MHTEEYTPLGIERSAPLSLSLSSVLLPEIRPELGDLVFGSTTQGESSPSSGVRVAREAESRSFEILRIPEFGGSGSVGKGGGVCNRFYQAAVEFCFFKVVLRGTTSSTIRHGGCAFGSVEGRKETQAQGGW